MPPTNKKLKAEAVLLRIEERLSYTEITERLGVPQGTLSGWLREYPLTRDEITAKQKSGRRPGPYKDRGLESKFHKQVPEGALTRLQKAKLAETAALFRMLMHGMVVFGSPFAGPGLGVDIGGTFKKVQVKWARKQQGGLPVISMQRRQGHRGYQPYQAGDFDFIVGYHYFTDVCYVWSWDEVKDYTYRITICPEAAEAWEKMSS